MRFDDWSVPGYKEAAEKEIADWDAPFTGLNEWILGIEVKPLTLIAFNRLEAIGSPFAVGERIPTVEDVELFLWFICKDFTEQRTLMDKVRRVFLRITRKRIIRKNHLGFIRAIDAYMDKVFPPQKNERKQTRSKQYSSFNAVIINEICAAYGGYDHDKVLNTPIRMLMQFRKWIQYDRTINLGGQPNPPRNDSDAILDAFTQKINGWRSN